MGYVSKILDKVLLFEGKSVNVMMILTAYSMRKDETDGNF